LQGQVEGTTRAAVRTGKKSKGYPAILLKADRLCSYEKKKVKHLLERRPAIASGERQKKEEETQRHNGTTMLIPGFTLLSVGNMTKGGLNRRARDRVGRGTKNTKGWEGGKKFRLFLSWNA